MVQELTDATFKTNVLQSKIPVIVDFWASWCGPCKMLAPIFEQVSKKFEGKVKFAKLSTEDYLDLAQEYEITSIPCMIVFKDGKEVDRIIGMTPAPMLEEKVKEIAKVS